MNDLSANLTRLHHQTFTEGLQVPELHNKAFCKDKAAHGKFKCFKQARDMFVKTLALNLIPNVVNKYPVSGAAASDGP